MSYKGTSWKDHKYVKKVGNRYFYDNQSVTEEKEDELTYKIGSKTIRFDDVIKEKNTKLSKSVEDSNRGVKDLKMDSEAVKYGLSIFNRFGKGFIKNSDTIPDNLVNWIESFNKLISKHF